MAKQKRSVLETRIKKLRRAIAAMSVSTDLDELLKVIHRPGWTTPAEMQFVVTMLALIADQVMALEALSAGLLSASKAVGI